MTVIVPKISKLVELPPGEYELELVGQPDDFRLSADKVTLTKGQKQTISILEVPPEKPPYEITELQRFEGHTALSKASSSLPMAASSCPAAGDKTMRLWDVETGKEVRQFEGNTQAVCSVAFSPDGRQASRQARTERIAISRSASGMWTPARKFVASRDTRTKSRMAAFSPDGSQVISCSNDRTVRLWDVKTGAELRQFTGHENEVRCVAFAPDGRRVLSGRPRRDSTAVGRGHRQGSARLRGTHGLGQRGRVFTRRAASRLQRRGTRACGCGTWKQVARSGRFPDARRARTW